MRGHRLGTFALIVIVIFCLIGVYAPLLASSKPLVVKWDDNWFFPLFRYLFYRGFFTKRLDLFFNLLMLTLPLFLLSFRFGIKWFAAMVILHFLLFFYIGWGRIDDPASEPVLNRDKQAALKSMPDQTYSWQFQLDHMTPYAQLDLVLDPYLEKKQHIRLKCESADCKTLWQIRQDNERKRVERLIQKLEKSPEDELARRKLQYLRDQKKWLKKETEQLSVVIMPLIRPFHWEDDAGGDQVLNQKVSWYDLTRINRKDLTAALIFGTRISMVVGIVSVVLALLIGVPFGAVAGYHGGSIDIFMSRLLEVWESMPTLFMLLLIVAITQNKSIFLVIAVIGFFGWTGFCRFTRGEFFKQRNLPYVEACYAMGLSNSYTMFNHILPNAVPPLLTLLPFAIMGAITTEAGLSFLGLGEEGSCSWGVLMDEGRSAFPAENYLLWPPAIALTILLIAIALVGDALRDILDPKMNVNN